MIPETAADAESKQQSITEKDEAPVSNLYRSLAPHVIDRLIRRQEPTTSRRPNGMGRIRPTRKLAQQNISEICGLVKRWEQLPKVPSWKEALTREYISHEAKLHT